MRQWSGRERQRLQGFSKEVFQQTLSINLLEKQVLKLHNVGSLVSLGQNKKCWYTDRLTDVCLEGSLKALWREWGTESLPQCRSVRTVGGLCLVKIQWIQNSFFFFFFLNSEKKFYPLLSRKTELMGYIWRYNYIKHMTHGLLNKLDFFLYDLSHGKRKIPKFWCVPGD